MSMYAPEVRLDGRSLVPTVIAGGGECGAAVRSGGKAGGGERVADGEGRVAASSTGGAGAATTDSTEKPLTLVMS